MKLNLFTKLMLIVVGILLAINLIFSSAYSNNSNRESSENVSKAAKNIQYKVVYVNERGYKQLESKLNEYSSQGWELDKFIDATGVLGNGYTLIFKK